MLVSLWPNWWQDWEYQWKCTFIGETRQIIINPAVDEISVKRDIYSAWKEWVRLRDNSKFPAALRTIGGDPTGDNLLAGDIYFLINDWEVVVNHKVRIRGVLYSDDRPDAYVVNDGGGLIATVSNLVQTAIVNVDGSGSTPSGDCPSANDIAFSVRNELSVELSRIDAPISSRASGSSLNTLSSDINNNFSTINSSFSTIVDLLTVLDAKIDVTQSEISDIDVDLTQLLTILEELRKFNFNRSLIDPTQKTLTIFDDDGATPLVVFSLKDSLGNPSIEEVAERDPQ